MDEKTMVNDILAGVKSDLTAYQTAITEAENMNLRQTFQQIRNNDESFQFELFKIAQNELGNISVLIPNFPISSKSQSRFSASRS